MSFKLPDLPYARDALAPHISAETLDFHHGKHHAGYIEKLNKAVEGTPYESMSLEALIRKSSDEGDEAVFNNGAQAWNHAFYWNSMSPDGGGEPEGDLAQRIKRDFGSFKAFEEKFTQAGKSQFGSGWAWLIVKGGTLDVRQTLNAHTPLEEDGATPLLTMDVWEHAYYLDYRNRRPDYIEAFFRLVNWDFAAENLRKAR